MRRATKKRIERVADAIKFLVPLDGGPHTVNGNALSAWTPKGLAEVKWPKSFGKNERKIIRAIAKTAIEL